jgi:hypothetical protein
MSLSGRAAAKKARWARRIQVARTARPLGFHGRSKRLLAARLNFYALQSHRFIGSHEREGVAIRMNRQDAGRIFYFFRPPACIPVNGVWRTEVTVRHAQLSRRSSTTLKRGPIVFDMDPDRGVRELPQANQRHHVYGERL